MTLTLYTNILRKSTNLRQFLVKYIYMKLEINKRIKELRKLNNLTQTQLAEKLQTTQDTISLWELGKSYPDIESLIILCKIFNISADYLLGLEDI